jgi:hypothetical protein
LATATVGSIRSTPVSAAVSRRLGVITVARGNNLRFIASTASSFSSASPLLATMTGSQTYGESLFRRIASSTTSIIARLPSMPVLVASAAMSPTVWSIWSRTSDGSSSKARCTPSVFCAVMAVTALMPYTPRTEKTFRSAWMPAPPEESEPAMVKAVFMRGGSSL